MDNREHWRVSIRALCEVHLSAASGRCRQKHRNLQRDVTCTGSFVVACCMKHSEARVADSRCFRQSSGSVITSQSHKAMLSQFVLLRGAEHAVHLSGAVFGVPARRRCAVLSWRLLRIALPRSELKTQQKAVVS